MLDFNFDVNFDSNLDLNLGFIHLDTYLFVSRLSGIHNTISSSAYLLVNLLALRCPSITISIASINRITSISRHHF